MSASLPTSAVVLVLTHEHAAGLAVKVAVIGQPDNLVSNLAMPHGSAFH